jgi:hypothetical protein
VYGSDELGQIAIEADRVVEVHRVPGAVVNEHIVVVE